MHPSHVDLVQQVQPEVMAVAANAGLMVVLLLSQQIHHDVTKGIPWAFGNRADQERSPMGHRIERTVRNHLEAIVVFTPIALSVALTNTGTTTTAGAAAAFVGLRTLYSLTYVAGVPVLRSILWTGALACAGVVAWPLLTTAG